MSLTRLEHLMSVARIWINRAGANLHPEDTYAQTSIQKALETLHTLEQEMLKEWSDRKL